MDGLETLVVPTEQLDDARRREIVAVCNAANDTEAFHELFARYVPSGGCHAVGLLGGEVVAHAVATTRWAQPGGCAPLRTAYIDAVATQPAYQGRGIGSAVMRRLGEALDEFEIGCLQTDVVGFYEQVGWEVWRGPLAGRADDGSLIATPEQRGVMVLRLAATPPLDLDSRLTIERQPERIWE